LKRHTSSGIRRNRPLLSKAIRQALLVALIAEGARSVVVATGARYRRLDVENLDAFEASSVHYWASPLEARLCTNQEVTATTDIRGTASVLPLYARSR
jgi:alkyl hydroperoxide reductase subunit AhpF